MTILFDVKKNHTKIIDLRVVESDRKSWIRQALMLMPVKEENVSIVRLVMDIKHPLKFLKSVRRKHLERSINKTMFVYVLYLDKK